VESALRRIDVFIPCYNYGRFLRQSVNSVLGQGGVDVRVLVIDDASADNTPEVAAALAREDPRVTVIRHSTNKGHINTYNEGIGWASGDYMLLLSADDYLLPGALRRAADLMDAHPEVGVTFGNAIELSDSGNEIPINFINVAKNSDKRIFEGREFIELCGADCLVATCTAVVRTELQKRLGGYRHELPHSGDVEMWLRFAVHASVGFISAYQGVYRQHKSNMSTAYYFISDGRIIYKKGGRLGDLQQRKSALDCLSEHCNDVVPGSEHLCRRLYWRLSELAVRRASWAFNEGETEESRELSDFALSVCPEIKSSSAWVALTCKRWMGGRIWRAVRPVAAAIGAMQRN
jgi:glycosyltransferase involved in cell wall biosynthesis